LTLRSTSGVGTTGADIILQTGNNGATEAMRILNSGNVGIGTASPTATMHIKAGVAAASGAPLKLTSGTLLTTAEAGAIEFLSDAFHATITTGAARKTFAFLESPALVTPALGIPASGDLSNCSFPTFNQSTTGLAATSTALATPRAINTVNFDGTAAITVTAAADTLTATTLASNVVTSSLTSFGTSPTLSGTPTAPTAAVDTNTTQIATTAFVLANAGGGGGTSGLETTFLLMGA